MFNTTQFNTDQFNSDMIGSMSTSKVATQWRPPDSGTAAPDNFGFFVLLETGDYLLLETGDKMLLEDTIITEKEPVDWNDN